MNPPLNFPSDRAPDFLAEMVSRTYNAAPKRTRIADRLIWMVLAGDALVIALSAMLAFWLRFRSPWLSATAAPVSSSDYNDFILLGTIGLLGAIASLRVYDRHLLLHLEQTALRICKAWAFWLCGALTLAAVINLQPSISRLFVALFSGGSLAGLLTWRWLFHAICRSKRVAHSLRERVLLIGWNPHASSLARTMRTTPTGSYELIGWLPLEHDAEQVETGDVPCLGSQSDLVSILRYSRIDIVIFTEDVARRDDLLGVAAICEREMVQFELIPPYFQVLLTGLHLHHFNGLPLLGVSKLPLNHLRNRILKRSIDLVGGAIGLLISIPIILLFGLLVFLESPGPVFYRQRRAGKQGRSFDIIKIRSMRLHAEQEGEVGWSTRIDPRRLRIGSIMRKWNIDELPQFWNVLKGDISLVGARPERPELIASFKHDIPHYNARHTVKPGLTGWAQVHGLRGDTDLTERIRHDIYYIENWSLGLDLQIMFLTLFRHSNAC